MLFAEINTHRGVNMYCISVNYKNSDINIRKKLAFTEGVQSDILKQLLSCSEIQQCVILCTCNRTELYFCGNEDAVTTAEKVLSQRSGINMHILKKHLYVFYHKQAVQHLFKVASGIESMVIGEDEILGQIKLAYSRAQGCDAAGFEINQIFQSAIACAKKIKTETAISKTSVSTATLAANEISRFKDNVMVLVIGATGKIGTTLVKNLLSHKNVTVVTTLRNHSASLSFTGDKIKTVDYAKRYDYVDSADCIVSATAGPHYTITYNDLSQNIKRQKSRLLIDLAVPPDIDSQVTEIFGVQRMGIDYFEQLAQENNALKMDSVETARVIIQKEIDVLKKDIAFHYFLPYVEKLRSSLSKASFEDVLYKLKAEMSADEFIKTLEVLKGFDERS